MAFAKSLLPAVLGLIMVGMGMSLVLDDFRRVFEKPRAVLIGLGCQMLLLPAVGFTLVELVEMPGVFAIGFLIIAACPGGPGSNLVAFLARADVALSVTLTAFSSVLTVFTIPLLVNLAIERYGGEAGLVSLPVFQTVVRLLAVVLVPIVLGMVVRARWPRAADRVARGVRGVAGAILILAVVAIAIEKRRLIAEYVPEFGGVAFVLNAGTMALGFGFGWLGRLRRPQILSIGLETGIQNVPMSLVVAASLVGREAMVIPGAVYTVMMYLTVLTVLGYTVFGARQSARDAQSQPAAVE